MNADRNTPYGTKIKISVREEFEKGRGSRGWFVGPDLEDPKRWGLVRIKQSDVNHGDGIREFNGYSWEHIFIDDWEDE